MDKIELKARTKKFSIDIIRLIEKLPSSRSLNVLCNQLLRSSSSVASNYRAACKGKSTADFLNKIVIVEEEADESLFWLELMEESGLVNSKDLTELKKEANELTAIFTAIGRTTRLNQKSNNSEIKQIRNPKSEIRN
ncbi:MAG: four helix bundle protein [Bacteroidetes bacterium]|nr:four helix bundle protein [Bacteroidota bacterium]